MSDKINTYNNMRHLSPKTLDLLRKLIDSVSVNPKWAYCCGGEIDTQIVPCDFPDNPRVKIRAEQDMKTFYTGESSGVADISFFDCEVKKVGRCVTTTIKDGIWWYDITFADKAVVLICDPLRAPREVPDIYEMCWYGREVVHMNRFLNTTISVANIRQEDGK